MLVLKITDERDTVRKVKGVFRKKIVYEELSHINRSSLCINGKTVITLELPFSKMNCDDVIKLLNIHKGQVLASEKYNGIDNLKGYIFSPKEYYQRAVVSSLINQMKNLNKELETVCIKTAEFVPFKELFEIVRISKSVVLIAPKNIFTNKFLSDCYYEYGAVVTVKGGADSLKYDVFLDLDEIDDKGKLMISVKGKSFLLYPDISYFQDNIEYQKLLPFNIEHNKICAAFSDK